MKKTLILIVAALAGLAAASAQSTYEHKQFTSSDGFSLNYRELTPVKMDAKKKYPEEYGFGLRHKNAIAWAELPEPYKKDERIVKNNASGGSEI